MKEGKVKSSNKGLVVLLCVLLVAIVGLGIGIGVIMIRNGDEIYSGLDSTEYILDLTRTAMDLNDFEAGADLYETAIAMNGDNLDILLDLRIAYSVFLAYGDFSEDSLAQLDAVKQDGLNVAQKIKLYTAYRDYYVYTGYDEKVDEYEARISDFIVSSGINQNVSAE